MKLLWFTDLHLVAMGSRLQDVDPVERFSRCLNAALEAHAGAQLMVITGDIAHRRSAAGYDSLKRLVQGMQIPLRLLPGNHDDARQLSDRFHSNASYSIERQYKENLGGWNLLYVNTSSIETSQCGLDDRQIAWLEEELLSESASPTLLFMHHPPFPTGIPGVDKEGFANRDVLGQMLMNATQPLHIFCGHCHRNISGSWRGIPFSALGGTHLSFLLELSSERLHTIRAEPVYGVIVVDGLSVAVHSTDIADMSPGAV